MADPHNQLLLIGLDAADPDLIERWTNDGTLPNLAALRRAGTWGRLSTAAKYLTGSPWPTFYTGRPPSDHGLYHDFQWRHERMEFAAPAADWLPLRPFWRAVRRPAGNRQRVEPEVGTNDRFRRGVRFRPDLVWRPQQPTDEIYLMGQHIIEHTTTLRFVAEKIGMGSPTRGGKRELETGCPKLAPVNSLQSGPKAPVRLTVTPAESHLEPATRSVGSLHHPSSFRAVQSHRLLDENVQS